MRLSVRLLASIAILVFVIAAPAAAQDPAFSEEDAELAEQFEAELLLLLALAGDVDADQVPELIGIKGELDLPPGTATLDAV